MKLDIYKIYHAVRERARRHAGTFAELPAQKMKAAMKAVLEDPTVDSARRFSQLEQEWASTAFPKKLYGNQLISAVVSGNFEVKRPVAIRNFCLGDDPQEGWIYIATAVKRPGEVKVGYTTIGLEKRLQVFQSKHGFPLEIAYSAIVPYPARLEEAVHDALRGVRSWGGLGGVEWFEIGALECQKILESLRIRRSEEVINSAVINDVSCLESFLSVVVGESDSKTLLSECSESSLRVAIENCLGSITQDEAKVIRKYFGLFDSPPKSILAIADETGVAVRRIDNMLTKAVRKVSHPSRSSAIRGALTTQDNQGVH